MVLTLYRSLGVYLALALLGLVESFTAYDVFPGFRGQLVVHLTWAFIMFVTSVTLAARRRSSLALERQMPFLAWIAGAVASILIVQFATHAFASSGDEYGYNYLADTFLNGRLWNPSREAVLRDALETFYIADRDGKRASQYAPGWPALLMVFKLCRMSQFGNVLVGSAASGFLWFAMKQLYAPLAPRLGAFLITTLSPFVLFNNASYYNHSLTAAVLLLIIWLDLRDSSHASIWNTAGIGLCFSLLLVTRYETFLISLSLFVVDTFIRKGKRGIGWLTPAAVAAVQVSVVLLIYNWRITGSPFLTTLKWASPEIGYGLHSTGVDGRLSLSQSLIHTVTWTESWIDFTSIAFSVVYLAALMVRLRMRTLRWFDVILPALVVFFFFYPDEGGFQHGPRYWYFGYMAMPVTVVAALGAQPWQLGLWSLDPIRLAGVQLASFIGFTIGYGHVLDLQTNVRQIPLSVARQLHPQSVLLIEDQFARYTPHQKAARYLLGKDYTRNGLGALGPIVIARDLGETQNLKICQALPGYKLFKLKLETTSSEPYSPQCDVP